MPEVILFAKTYCVESCQCQIYFSARSQLQCAPEAFRIIFQSIPTVKPDVDEYSSRHDQMARNASLLTSVLKNSKNAC
jgi:hypothetical protein